MLTLCSDRERVLSGNQDPTWDVVWNGCINSCWIVESSIVVCKWEPLDKLKSLKLDDWMFMISGEVSYHHADCIMSTNPTATNAHCDRLGSDQTKHHLMTPRLPFDMPPRASHPRKNWIRESNSRDPSFSGVFFLKIGTFSRLKIDNRGC